MAFPRLFSSLKAIRSKFLWLGFTLFPLFSISFSQNLWTEAGAEGTYRGNDFYIIDSSHYLLLHSSVKTGLTVIQKKNILFLQIYATGNLTKDLLGKIWNKVDWHNNVVGGGGCRIRIHPNFGEFLSLEKRELNLEFFAEKTWIKYFPNKLFFTGHRPRDDFKNGFQFYAAFDNSNMCTYPTNNKRLLYAWFDLGGAFYYAKSSFYNVSQTGFYISSLDAKIGLGLNLMKRIPLEYYFSCHTYYDFGKGDWNKLDWNNRLIYGIGIRMKYFSPCYFQAGKANLRIFPFVELFWVHYYKKAHYIPSFRPDFDLAGGISLWVSWMQRR